MECQYCKKILQTKSSLNSHQTKTKYCLQLQGKDQTKGLFLCEGCNKDFHRKLHLTDHIKVCEYCIPKVKELLKKIEILEKEKKDWLQEKKDLVKLQEYPKGRGWYRDYLSKDTASQRYTMLLLKYN